jgi:hypothetical protein
MSPGREFRPEWRSGRSPATPVVWVSPPYPTFSHSATRFPTFPSDVSATASGCVPFLALQSGKLAMIRGGRAPRGMRAFACRSLG